MVAEKIINTEYFLVSAQLLVMLVFFFSTQCQMTSSFSEVLLLFFCLVSNMQVLCSSFHFMSILISAVRRELCWCEHKSRIQPAQA